MHLKIASQLCKGCGICEAFCPKQVLSHDSFDKVVVINEQGCIGCVRCEILCPDFAIKVIKE